MDSLSGKEKLCKALLKLMENHKLKEISVKELVAEAGVNRSTYNYHFYSMEEVFNEVISGFAKGLVSSFSLGDQYGHISSITGFEVESNCFQYIETRKHDVTVLIDNGYGLVLMDRIEKELEKLFRGYILNFISETGEKETLSEGLSYELRIREFCYAIVADLEFWTQYINIISLENMTQIAKQVKHVHLISAKKK